MRTLIPPIKCQGIKSKLVGFIEDTMDWNEQGVWIEPFLGSGVVGFNVAPRRALLCDTNPHIIAFYKEVQAGSINESTVKQYLSQEGQMLSENGKDYYYEVRSRFNMTGFPLDFLFLNRACFNGLIRYNGKGKFNVPFGHKPNRFSKAYITKIANQVNWVAERAMVNDWTFECQDFRDTLRQANAGDFIYCDPPYYGRHTDYFNRWDSVSEKALVDCLRDTEARFMLSTWHSNQYRHNANLDNLWSDFNHITREHFYHVGAKETNRNPMLEALVTNFVPVSRSQSEPDYRQIGLFTQ